VGGEGIPRVQVRKGMVIDKGKCTALFT
jgi:hypothetical protein